MRRNGWDDEIMILPAFDEGTRGCKRVFEGLSIRSGELEHGLTKDGTQTDFRYGFCDLLLEVVHVGKRGDAGADVLGAGDGGA